MQQYNTIFSFIPSDLVEEVSMVLYIDLTLSRLEFTQHGVK